MWRLSIVTVCLSCSALQAGEFRVLPYLQNPAEDAITIRWLSESPEPGELTLEVDGQLRHLTSSPARAAALAMNPFKEEPGVPHAAVPWIHSIRVENLKPANEYAYAVTQSGEKHSATFRTPGSNDRSMRFIVYSDSETEPESSTSPPVGWPVSTGSNRPETITTYVADQTAGYRANCRILEERKPDLLLIVGDLVECGGEQRDWDEFWKHNAGEYSSLASRIPVIPALGNHENYGGPGGGYSAEGANFGTDKYLTYFDVPDNGAGHEKHKGRYFRIDYGPVTLISLDSSDGSPSKSAADTNHNLEGSNAPDFNPGSEQFAWAETQLADAQRKGQLLFVQFHHTMFGSGPHSIPFGNEGFSGQSGIPMRIYLPLFLKYGVDLVFSGHDEMLERSVVTGQEQLLDGTTQPHAIHFYDVGIGGDGLRGPSTGFDNPFRKFLAHENAAEVWENGKLISGGKHYGHLEVNVSPSDNDAWTIEVSPVYAFPILDEDSAVVSWERRVYDDVVTITTP